MTEHLILVTALSQGFFGSPHCLGMCGGIVSALTFALADKTPQQRFMLQCVYHLGRLLSYSLLGLGVGLLGKGVISPLFNSQWPYVITGAIMVAVGLYLTGWWRGLDKLERVGAKLWHTMAPLRQRFMPINNLPRALAAGMLWGFLPCGLVYSALLLAFSSASPTTAAATLFAFGVGTLPMMLLAGTTAGALKQKLQQQGWRTANGILIAAFGVWTLLRPLMHHDDASHHHHQPAVTQPAAVSTPAPSPTVSASSIRG